MAHFKLITTDDEKAWITALELCGNYDIYHLPEYHLLAEKQGEGKAYLFYFEDGKHYAALPFLVRPISEVAGFEDCPYMDATSVYGYPGVNTSISQDHKDSSCFSSAFQQSLHQTLKEMGVISFFSRLNPLITTSWLFKGIGEVIPLSSTVSIDLTQPPSQQIKSMTKGHRYDIRKARSLGVTVREDPAFRQIDDFIKIYNETMIRNDARDYYFFTRDYFRSLKKFLGDSVKLYLAELNGEIISSSIFFVTKKIIQYHLSGTSSQYLPYAGAKVIIDEARIWGTENRIPWLHLGGGVSSQEDSLYRFKAGFSKFRHIFEVFKWVLEPNYYMELVHKRLGLANKNGNIPLSLEYFPLYRG